MKRFAGILFWCTLVFFTACVTADHAAYDTDLLVGNYAGVYKRLDAEQKRLYAAQDKLLYHLDAGMLLHFAGDYDASNRQLSQAETLIDYYAAKSVSQAIGSFVLNDSVIDYAGEDYEDIYTNLFMALNYIRLDKIEDAFVEIRRFDNKLKRLSSKYEKEVFAAKQQAEKQMAELNLSDSYAQGRLDLPFDLEFHNSAFARYISLLLYRSENSSDSAIIDKKYLESAFQTQRSLYPFPLPAAVEQEFSVPPEKARLNILCFTGRSPIKKEKIFRIPDITGGTWFKIAIPVMQKRSSRISSVYIEAIDGSGNKSAGTLEILESMENIAEDTFRQKQSLIYTKTFVRTLSKTLASAAAEAALVSQDDGSSDIKALGGFLRLLSGIFIEISERADLRCSRYFPAAVWAGGLNLDGGLYTVHISCYDKQRKLLYKDIKKDVLVKNTMLNITEFVCMQ
ncbi:hypothetical protein H0R92_03995 [Treponema sp. OMZ 840]|uniref:hypothetical protein n=1 Tax=Treponema sp. OMZ 840 TaxID=244313 RepID=UPI003D905599